MREAIAGLRAGGATGVSSGLTARLAHVYALQGRYDEADRWFDEAVASAEKQRYVPALALAYNLRGIMLRRRDRLDEAEQCHRDALALYADRAAPARLSLSLASLGYLAARRGQIERAYEQHAASLSAACEAADSRAEALALEGLAGVAMLLADAAAVGRYLGAAAGLREGTGGPLAPAERDDVERAWHGVEDRRLAEATYAEGHADPQAVVEAALRLSE